MQVKNDFYCIITCLNRWIATTIAFNVKELKQLKQCGPLHVISYDKLLPSIRICVLGSVLYSIIWDVLTTTFIAELSSVHLLFIIIHCLLLPYLAVLIRSRKMVNTVQFWCLRQKLCSCQILNRDRQNYNMSLQSSLLPTCHTLF